MGQDDRIFISVKEAAHSIRMSKEFVYSLIRRKKGVPFKRFGRSIRIPLQEFMVWAKRVGD